MAAMSNFLENKLLDWLFRGQAIGINGASAGSGTGPTQLWVGLYTATPTDAGGGTEVSGGSYTRVSLLSNMTNWSGTQGIGTTAVSSGTSGQTSNNIALTFPAPTANWGLITSFGIFDAVTGGNLLIWGPLFTSKTVNNADAAPAFTPAALVFQIDTET
jgi:hypothetical protein